MDHPHLIAAQELAFAGNANDIRALAGQFRGLCSRRLIITGGPGTGKTTLAVQLLRELLDSRSHAEPVPVMLSIASWDTARYRRLDEWLAAQLAVDYATLCAAEYGGDAAPRMLAEQGHILPVLDGLDELPASARAQVIRALNDSLMEGDQLILTSRTTEFAAAVQSVGDVVTAAAVIAPAALTPPIAATYLQTCLPPARRYDWGPVLAAIRSGSAPALSSVTTTPLGLWLIRMVYILPNADPAPLLGHLGNAPKALRRYLLDHLIDALIRARPPTSDPGDPFRPRQSWNPDQACTWLSHLAQALARNHTRDLAWWNIARYTTSPARRRLLTAAIGATAGFAVGLTGATLAAFLTFLTGESFSLRSAATVGGVLGLTAWILVWVKTRGWFDEVPGFQSGGRLAVIRTPSLRDIGLRLGVIVAGFLLSALTLRLPITQPMAILASFAFLMLGITGAAAIMFSAWVGQMEHPTPLDSATSASSAWRADRNLTLARILAAAFAFSVSVFGYLGVINLLQGGSTGYMVKIGLVLGIGFGLTGGFVAGVASGRHHAWLVCKIALLTQTRLPRRLIPFLDDMHRLGLLRTVGPLYQFRHAELHDHLAASAPLHAVRPAESESGRHSDDRDAGHV
ncbi:NACHT domain-containing protein [Streptosporangium carneum]